MKNLLTICALLLVSIDTRAINPDDYAFAQAEHPFRYINAKPCDLRTLQNWILARGYRNKNAAQPMPAWKAFTDCQIVYQGSSHILLQHSYWKGMNHVTSPHLIVLKNYPKTLRDGARIQFLAVDAGIETVRDRFGVPHKYQAYDFGKPLTPQETHDYLATLAPEKPTTTNAVTTIETNKPKLKITLSGQ